MTAWHSLRAAFAATLLSCIVSCPAAQAQTLPARTWVSSFGNDANDCSRAAPCSTFAGAYDKTAAGGQIGVLDSGSYGHVYINKAISIVADGVIAAIDHSFVSAAISIYAGANDVVHIKGLALNGEAFASSGIVVFQAKAVYVSDTRIRNYFGTAYAQVGCGVALRTDVNPVRVYLRNVEINNNKTGICVDRRGNVLNSVFVEDSTVEGNAIFSMDLDGANAGAAAIGSVFAPTGVYINGGASFASAGNNRIAGPVGPTSSLALR